jgi:hypothetical protein
MVGCGGSTDDGDDDGRGSARRGGAEQVECRHSRQCRQCAKSDRRRGGAGLCQASAFLAPTLALIHPGETIIRAARGTSPYTGAAMRAGPCTDQNQYVALDPQSVSRFFNDSKHMLRAINDAVKRGVHLDCARPVVTGSCRQ